MRVLLYFLLAFSSNVLSADYYWIISGGGSAQFPSAMSACSAQDFTETLAQGGNKFEAIGVNLNDPRNGICQVKVTRKDGTSYTGNYFRQVSRLGDSCPANSTYNTVTGGCDAPENPCTDKLGQTTEISTDVPKWEFCIDQCSAAAIDGSSSGVDSGSILTAKEGANEKVYYWYKVMYSGEQCTANDSATPDSPQPQPKTSDVTTECSPATTDAAGSTVSTCVTTKLDTDNEACVAAGGHVGAIDGVMQCVATGKGPTAKQVEKQVKVTTTTNPDGSTKTTTETTYTKTSCSGTAACTTTTTTTTNVTNTNADGSPGTSSSSCKGADCTSDGKADEGTDDGEEKEEEGMPGPTQSLAQGEQGSFSEGIAEWDARISDVRAELDQKLDQYSGLFSGVFDLNLGSGGGSLPCEEIPVSFGSFGSTTVRFCPADYSDVLSYLRFALLLGAAVIAAFVILRD